MEDNKVFEQTQRLIRLADGEPFELDDQTYFSLEFYNVVEGPLPKNYDTPDYDNMDNDEVWNAIENN